MSVPLPLVARMIHFIHFCFVVCLLAVPIVDGLVFDCEKYLTFVFIIIALVMIHWLSNNNKCALTVLESRLLGQDENDTFIGQIINPIYDANKRKKYGDLICVSTSILFLIVALMLKKKYQFQYFYNTLQKSLYII